MKSINQGFRSTFTEIDAVYISSSYFEAVNEQSCDCDEIVIKCGDKCIRLTSEAVGEDGRIVFDEAFSFKEGDYPYEVELKGERFVFDKSSYLENGRIDGIRFAADGVFLFVFALEHNLVLTMSKYDLFGEIEMDLPEEEATLTVVKRSMTNVFCDEPILAVYEGQRELADLLGANAFLDCYHELAYHVTEGYRILLETESFYISLTAKGITKTNKACSLSDFRRAGELIEPFTHHQGDDAHLWHEYPSTLFLGERLLHVEETESYYLLHFDDFEFKVVPHELNETDFPSLPKGNSASYHYVLGAERHLKSKCSCGGNGQLLLDFVSDYVVRCTKCKKSTAASILAYHAIQDWEEGYVECDLSDITIE